MSQRGVRSVVASLLAAVTLTASACAPEEVEEQLPPSEPEPPANTQYFGYQVNQPLVTTNAATAVGESTNAQLVAGRLYPSMYLPGPSGEMIPNTDLGTAQSLPGKNRQVVYTLSPDAQYSDGEPVTCVDYLLSYKAQKMNYLFDSTEPLLESIESMDCGVGAKEFTVVFREGQGGRWRHLFSQGTVLPAHAIAREAGLSMEELTAALHAEDALTLEPVAEIWKQGFRLDNFNPDLQVSSGPFVIREVGPRGEVVLDRNEHYYGDAALLDTVVVWPESVPSEDLIEHDALQVAEAHTAQPEWVSEDDQFLIEARTGDLTDALRLSETGILAEQWAREAFSHCVDQYWAAGVSGDTSGIETFPVAVQVIPHWDPLGHQLADISWPHAEVNHTAASNLAGSTIRIGYNGPDARKAGMVQAIAESCAPSGITVVDASEEGRTSADLGRVTTGAWGETVVEEGTIDAFLGPIAPMLEFNTVDSRATEVDRLREAEAWAWESMDLIPLSTQPRSVVVDNRVRNVVMYTGPAGVGWNMDRWYVEEDKQSGEVTDESGSES